MASLVLSCRSKAPSDKTEPKTQPVSTSVKQPIPTVLDIEKKRPAPSLTSPAPEELIERLADALIQEKAQLLVRVLREDGKPAALAKVTLLDGSSAKGREILCDKNGLAHAGDLLPGSYQLWASDNLQISALETTTAFPEDEEKNAIILQLAPATSLRGRIRAGTLGVAARVELVPVGHDHAIFQVESKADGEFHLPALPRGQWEPRVSAPQHSQLLNKRFSADTAEAYLDLNIVPNASIGGQVLSADKTPITGAQIRITPLGNTWHRGSSEQLELTKGIRWTHPLPGKRTLPIRDTRRFGARRSGIRPAECGAGHCGVDIGGQRGWPVLAAADGEVVVASSDDRGKSGRYVVLAHPGGIKTFYMHLDSVTADLSVGQTIPAGTLLGTLGRSGIQHSEPHLHFALSRSIQGQSIFLDPEPMLRFAVVRPDVPLLSGLTVYIEPSGSEGGGSTLLWTSDHEGRFHKSSLPPGKYRIQVLHPDFAPGQSRAFILSPGQVLSNVKITLTEGKRIGGQVVGPDGPVADAWIRAFQGEGESRQRVGVAGVDELGRFEMRPLLKWVELEIGGAGYGVVHVRVNANTISQHPKIYTLSRFDAQLRGQLRAPNGTPLESAQVQIMSGPAARGRRVLTDAYGFFQFDTIPTGEYQLRFRADKLPELEGKASTQSPSEFTMKEGASLQVILEDKQTHSALSGVRVLAKGPEKRSTTLLSDTLGRVQFEALLPGDWSISVDSPEFTPIAHTLKVSAGPLATHTLSLERGAMLSGVIYTPSGDRAVNAKIWFGSIQTKSDRNGVFRLDRVKTGRIQLRAKLGQLVGVLPLELFPGDELVTLEVTLGSANANTEPDTSEKDE